MEKIFIISNKIIACTKSSSSKTSCNTFIASCDMYNVKIEKVWLLAKLF